MTRTNPLEALELNPIGVTVIDLLGQNVPDLWGPMTTHGSRAAGPNGEPWTPDLGDRARKASQAAQKLVNKATKLEMVEWLKARGRVVYVEEKARMLRLQMMNEVHVAHFPRQFINAAPDVWVCSCGHEGPRKMGRGRFDFSCPECGRSGYLMQLKAVRDRIRSMRNTG